MGSTGIHGSTLIESGSKIHEIENKKGSPLTISLIVVCKFGTREPVGPIVLLEINEQAKVLFYLVIGMGNPQVFLAIPGPGPVEYMYPLWGYRYGHRLAKLTQGLPLPVPMVGNPRVCTYNRVKL